MITTAEARKLMVLTRDIATSLTKEELNEIVKVYYKAINRLEEELRRDNDEI